MPWEAKDHMTERVRFILRLQQPGARMTDVCRDFGISRKTGYKVRSRFEKHGLQGLGDRRPVAKRRTHATPAALRRSLGR